MAKGKGGISEYVGSPMPDSGMVSEGSFYAMRSIRNYHGLQIKLLKQHV